MDGTRYNQEGKHCLCKFQLESSSKTLLLNNSMSNADECCNSKDKNDKYIGPMDLWIKEACSSPDEPWRFFNFLLHDEDSIVDLV
jgi:hypothetical protein